eukprot:GFUD01027731.1.p1 GENE.GFUD01027731.1~~GFUD01027731.1.p1  ORF type:complete len:107 (+),score=10.39 GFUD01027731.1:71-391(+)
MMTTKLLVIISVLLTISTTEACIGSGCVHDRERDQFFWCSGNADKEIPAIKSFFGGVVNNGAYEAYCTGISAMLRTRDPATLAAAEKLCGSGHAVICHENISSRFY